MPYLPLPNFNHDSGPRRIQSGPDHEGYLVLYSGVESTGADDGLIVAGSPLSGTVESGVWGYDANWRYVPTVTVTQQETRDPTPYNVSGTLDTYDGTRIYTRDNVGGAQAASAIGPETGKINPRGGALQPRANVTRPETYMYYGGAAPDNQDYSPYNTPDANSAAEGKTGGGVTHRSYESTLLTNVLGSQGTSDRSQWRYHQPVYCKTYTETKRSDTPSLMSTPIRSVYRGGSTGYSLNYANQLLSTPGSFKPLEYDVPVTVDEEDIPIILGPVPFLWLSYNTDNSSFLSYGFDEAKIELDRFCNSYHSFIWGDGVSTFLQVVKRRPDGVIIWQKNYGNGVFSIPGTAGQVIETGYDSTLDTLYVYIKGTAGIYFLAIDTFGSIKFSKYIINPPITWGAYFVNSVDVNPVTHNITLAGAVSSTFFANNGVLITYDKNGNLVNSLTKITTVTTIFGGNDRSNGVRGLCYDNAGSMYIVMDYFTQDVFWNANTARRAILYASVDVNGNSTFFKQIGNFFQATASGTEILVANSNKSIYLSSAEDVYIVSDGNRYHQLSFNTLAYQQTYLSSFGSLSLYAQPREDSLTYIFSRTGLSPVGSFSSGRLTSMNSTTKVTEVSIGTAPNELTDGRISDSFNCTVASFGTQSTAGVYGRAYCIGFNPVGSGTVAISSGGVSYSVTYSTFPRVPSGMPTGVFYSSSDTSFTFMGQGTHPDGFTFSINDQNFVCPVSDAISPTWILIPSSGTYDPNL